MTQQKSKPTSPEKTKKPVKKTFQNPKTYGNEPPMIEPDIPEHPDHYEVNGSAKPSRRPTKH